jgi:hypothetical protein
MHKVSLVVTFKINHLALITITFKTGQLTLQAPDKRDITTTINIGINELSTLRQWD